MRGSRRTSSAPLTGRGHRRHAARWRRRRRDDPHDPPALDRRARRRRTDRGGATRRRRRRGSARGRSDDPRGAERCDDARAARGALAVLPGLRRRARARGAVPARRSGRRLRAAIGGEALHAARRAWFGRKGRAPRASALTTAALHTAQHELLRRLLHAHGPGDARTLASWLDVPAADALARWDRFRTRSRRCACPTDGRRGSSPRTPTRSVPPVRTGSTAGRGTSACCRRTTPSSSPRTGTDSFPTASRRSCSGGRSATPAPCSWPGRRWAPAAAASSGQLTVTLTPFPGNRRAARADGVEDEAERVARARGLRLAKVAVD